MALQAIVVSVFILCGVLTAIAVGLALMGLFEKLLGPSVGPWLAVGLYFVALMAGGLLLVQTTTGATLW